MKLMKMTDFVSELSKQTDIKSYAWFFLKCSEYAQFLKQTLTLEMFIGDKALFKGWVLHGEYIFDENNDSLCIEDLSHFKVDNLTETVTLTQYAIKQLGL